MKKYLVVIKESGTGYSAYSPDLPGCVATGATRAEVERNIGRTLSFLLNELRAVGELPAG